MCLYQNGNAICTVAWKGGYCNYKYRCNGNYCVWDAGGIYNSLADCQASCGTSGGGCYLSRMKTQNVDPCECGVDPYTCECIQPDPENNTCGGSPILIDVS